MIVEVISVGTELLLGQIVNSNAATIAQRLAEGGLDAHHQVTVGDNLERLTDAIAQAADRADAVVLTGGMGPTPDDLTRDALCAFAGVGIRRDDAQEQLIRERVHYARGTVTESALRMADYPEGSDPLPNSVGVALGAAMEHDGVHLFALPGVPSEMVAMLDDEVMPRLRAAAGEQAVLRSRLLQTVGLGESQVAELLGDLNDSANPTVAYMLTDNRTRVRISAKAPTVAAADAMIDEMASAVAARLGRHAVPGPAAPPEPGDPDGATA